MSVITKFSRVFWLIPFITLASLMLGVHYFYGVTPELLLDLIPALISTAAVLLLVWERLRRSIIRDLKGFHKYVLFKLYNEFKPKMNLFHIRPEPIMRLGADLEEYGTSILRLHLYPGKLPEMMDKFLELNGDFSPKLEKIEEFGEKELGSHYQFYKFLHYLGMHPFHSYSTQPVEDAHRDDAQRLLQEQPDLVNGAKNSLKKMGDTSEQIHELLDDFIKDNKLRLERERFYIPRP